MKTSTKRLTLGLCLASHLTLSAGETPMTMNPVPVSATSSHERPFAPPTAAAYLELPPGAVRPEGWLRDWCVTMAQGFTGRMEEVHQAFKQAWAADHKMTGRWLFWDHGGWPYEGGGYWFEGLTRLAHALHDDKLIAHAQRRFEPVIAGMRPDQGVLFFHWLDRNNPEQVAAAEGLTYRETEWPMWASGLLGRALVSHYEATRDPRALKALELAYSSDPRWIRMGWSPSNLGPAYDTWTWTGNAKIKAALDAFFAQGGTNEKGAWSWNRYAKAPKPGVWEDHTDHVVHQIESTVWALGYLWTGKREYLDAQLAWHEHLVRDGMQPYGVPVSDEFTGPPGAARGSETCDVANFLWSQTFLLGITGQGRLGDRMERAFFNAAPAVVTRDCRNHVYFQHPNRVVDAGGNASYRPSHHPLCCSAALNRMVPTYVTRMWMATPDQGLALVLHGPSRVRALVAKDVPVEIISRTAYPFEETIELTVNPAKAVAFPLSIRVPGWCTAPAITVAGAGLAVKAVDGFVRIQRTWQPGQVLRLHFPMTPRIETGRDVGIPANQRHEILAPSVAARAAQAAPYASVVYGPLLFSLPVAEGKDANTADPASAWKFALAGATMKVERDPMPASWTWPLAAPLRLKLPAQAINWAKATALPKGLEPDTTTTEIALVPHGCTKLRVSMFPVTESAWRALSGPELQQRPSP